MHASSLQRSGLADLAEGQRVAVEVADGQKGPEADNADRRYYGYDPGASYYGNYPDYGYGSHPNARQTWYYCSDPAGYYPYVTQCKIGWQSVPAS